MTNGACPALGYELEIPEFERYDWSREENETQALQLDDRQAESYCAWIGGHLPTEAEQAAIDDSEIAREILKVAKKEGHRCVFDGDSEHIYHDDPRKACPWVFTRTKYSLEKHREILQNLKGEEMEATQAVLMPDLPLHNDELLIEVTRAQGRDHLSRSYLAYRRGAAL